MDNEQTPAFLEFARLLESSTIHTECRIGLLRLIPEAPQDVLSYLDQLIEASPLSLSTLEHCSLLEPGTIERWRRHPEEISPAAYLEIGELVAMMTFRTPALFFFEVYMTIMVAEIRAGKIPREPILQRLEQWIAFAKKVAERESKEGAPHGRWPHPIPLRRK